MSRGQGLRRGTPSTPGVAAPADRRFRRADVSLDRRRRTTRVVARVIRWGIPIALVAVAAVWGGYELLHSGLLRIRHVVVVGTARLSSGEVMARLDGIREENVLLADLQSYRQRLLDSPWVADVTLARVLPSTVEVRVQERVPMAVARVDSQLFLVDDTGVVIDEFGAAYQQYDLPIVDGLLVAARGGGPAAPAERTRLASGLLTALATRADLRGHVSQIDVSNPRDAVVMLDDVPVWLHLGDEQFVDRLQTFVDLQPTLQAKFRDVVSVDLRFGGRVYVQASTQAVPGASARRVR